MSEVLNLNAEQIVDFLAKKNMLHSKKGYLLPNLSSIILDSYKEEFYHVLDMKFTVKTAFEVVKEKINLPEFINLSHVYKWLKQNKKTKRKDLVKRADPEPKNLARTNAGDCTKKTEDNKDNNISQTGYTEARANKLCPSPIEKEQNSVQTSELNLLMQRYSAPDMSMISAENSLLTKSLEYCKNQRHIQVSGSLWVSKDHKYDLFVPALREQAESEQCYTLYMPEHLLKKLDWNDKRNPFYYMNEEEKEFYSYDKFIKTCDWIYYDPRETVSPVYFKDLESGYCYPLPKDLYPNQIFGNKVSFGYKSTDKFSTFSRALNKLVYDVITSLKNSTCDLVFFNILRIKVI